MESSWANIENAQAEPSVRSVGESYVIALAETIIGLYETEVIHPDDAWRNADEIEFATLVWVD